MRTSDQKSQVLSAFNMESHLLHSRVAGVCWLSRYAGSMDKVVCQKEAMVHFRAVVHVACNFSSHEALAEVSRPGCLIWSSRVMPDEVRKKRSNQLFRE